MSKDFSSLEELKRGDAKGLEEFYNHLKSPDDLESIISILPEDINKDYGEEIKILKEEVRAKTYTSFIKTTQTGILLVFFMLSMFFVSCGNDKQEEAVKKEDTVQKKDTFTGEPKPAYGAVDFDKKNEAGIKLPVNTDTLSTVQTKALLLDYITKAELDAREKRRLKKRLNDTKDKDIAVSKTDLSKLFATNSPKEIAGILEKMAIFNEPKAKTKPSPPLVKYMGPVYDKKSEVNPPRVVYGGVDYFKKGGK
jgi:hypothetical protein